MSSPRIRAARSQMLNWTITKAISAVVRRAEEPEVTPETCIVAKLLVVPSGGREALSEVPGLSDTNPHVSEVKLNLDENVNGKVKRNERQSEDEDPNTLGWGGGLDQCKERGEHENEVVGDGPLKILDEMHLILLTLVDHFLVI